jgi:hypothetical protein
MRRVDRYRPAHPPYKAAAEIGSLGAAALKPYTAAVVTHLKAEKRVTLNESYYLYFLARMLDRLGEDEMRAALEAATAASKIVNLAPMATTAPSVAIPGLENVKKVNWRFLPDPENLSAGELLELLKEHFSEHAGHAGIQLEIGRIEFALSLKPKEIFVGLEEFAGYYAFVFPGDVVLFECPAYGNAAYIVRGDWRVLSQQYKAQLERKGIRVIHSVRSWKRKIRWAIDARMAKERAR